MSNTTPTLQRTWQFDLNNSVTGSTTQDGGATDGPRYRKQLLMDIKEKLCGFASNPWTVAQSHGLNSGIVIAPTVGSAGRPGDNWDPSDLTEIRWASSGTRTWIVLENAALGMQLCLEQLCDPSEDGALMEAWICPVGTPFGSLAAGTISSRPTSSLERQISDAFDFGSFGSWGSGARDAASRRYALHVMHSTDGIGTRVIVCLNGVANGFWYFDRIEDEIAPNTYKHVARIAQANDDNASSITTTHLYTNARLYGQRNDGTFASYYMGMPANNSQNQPWEDAQAIANQFDGRLSLAPVCVASESAGNEGLMGILYDTWYETEPGYTGKGWPGTNNALMQFDCMVFPWDGSIPLVS